MFVYILIGSTIVPLNACENKEIHNSLVKIKMSTVL